MLVFLLFTVLGAADVSLIKNIDVVIIVSVLWFAIVTCVLMSSSLSLLLSFLQWP